MKKNKSRIDLGLNKRFRKLTTLILASIIIMSLFGCTQNTAVGPIDTESGKRKTSEITFLKSKNPRLSKVFNRSQLVTAASGGTVQIGDETTGISSITFAAGDLSNDLTVEFWWNSQNFEADLGPHGSTFNNPIVIRLSYKDADLGNIDEEDLRIWYYDENDDMWEPVGQVVNTVEKYVEGTTPHFSRYSVGL